jgi:hypothetical protein
VSAAAVSWQDIAHALARKPERDKRPMRSRGKRVIPQETIRAIRHDASLNTMTRVAIAAKYGVTPHYVYQVVDCGLRDEEREALR